MRTTVGRLRETIRECVLTELWIEPLVSTEIVATKSFKPEYMGGTWKIHRDDVFKVMGASLPDPYTDKSYGIPNPILPFPSASNKTLNYRVRLMHVKSGKTVFVTTNEFERFFDAAVEELEQEEENEMPGEEVFKQKKRVSKTGDVDEVPNMPGSTPILKMIPPDQRPTEDIPTTLIRKKRIG